MKDLPSGACLRVKRKRNFPPICGTGNPLGILFPNDARRNGPYSLSGDKKIIKSNGLVAEKLDSEHLEPNDLAHAVKIGIVVKQEKIIFDRCLGDQAIDCTINCYSSLAAF